jgi:hypothetical protein
MGAEMSTPVTWPVGPTLSARDRLVAPAPQPMSSTRQPAWGASAAMAASPRGLSMVSSVSTQVAQVSPAAPFQNSA